MAPVLRSPSKAQQHAQQQGVRRSRRLQQQPDRYGQYSSVANLQWESGSECSEDMHDSDTSSAERDSEAEEPQDPTLGHNSQPASAAAAAANHVGSKLLPANKRRRSSTGRSPGKSPALIMLPDGGKAVRMAYHLTKQNHQLFVPLTLAQALPCLPHTLAVRPAIDDQPEGDHTEDTEIISANRLYRDKVAPYYYLDQSRRILRDYIGYTVSKLTINAGHSQLTVHLQSRAGRQRTEAETPAPLAAAAAAAAHLGSNTLPEHQSGMRSLRATSSDQPAAAITTPVYNTTAARVHPPDAAAATPDQHTSDMLSSEPFSWQLADNHHPQTVRIPPTGTLGAAHGEDGNALHSMPPVAAAAGVGECSGQAAAQAARTSPSLLKPAGTGPLDGTGPHSAIPVSTVASQLPGVPLWNRADNIPGAAAPAAVKQEPDGLLQQPQHVLQGSLRLLRPAAATAVAPTAAVPMFVDLVDSECDDDMEAAGGKQEGQTHSGAQGAGPVNVESTPLVKGTEGAGMANAATDASTLTAGTRGTELANKAVPVTSHTVMKVVKSALRKADTAAALPITAAAAAPSATGTAAAAAAALPVAFMPSTPTAGTTTSSVAFSLEPFDTVEQAVEQLVFLLDKLSAPDELMKNLQIALLKLHSLGEQESSRKRVALVKAQYSIVRFWAVRGAAHEALNALKILLAKATGG